MTKKRQKHPPVASPAPSAVCDEMLDTEIEAENVPAQAHTALEQAQMVPGQMQTVPDQAQVVPEQVRVVPERPQPDTDRIEMEPKHITFAEEEKSDKVEAWPDKVECMAAPTAAGADIAEEAVSVQSTSHLNSPTSPTLSIGSGVGATRRKACKQKPLYKWELPVEEREALEASKRAMHVTTGHGDFKPGEHPGYFHRERHEASIDATDDRSSPSKPVSVLDFQIVLSEAEYRTLQSRRRSLSRRRGLAVGPSPVPPTTSGSLCTSGGGAGERREGVMASSPYIDPWRVERTLQRPAHKDIWISPSGFT